MHDVWGWLWLAWFAAFGVIEGVALARDSDGTLSNHLRHWFYVNTHTGRTTFVVLTGALAAVLVVHIVG